VGAPACHSHTTATPPHIDRYRVTAYRPLESHSLHTKSEMQQADNNEVDKRQKLTAHKKIESRNADTQSRCSQAY
jgi:hypothetical protein